MGGERRKEDTRGGRGEERGRERKGRKGEGTTIEPAAAAFL